MDTQETNIAALKESLVILFNSLLFNGRTMHITEVVHDEYTHTVVLLTRTGFSSIEVRVPDTFVIPCTVPDPRKKVRTTSSATHRAPHHPVSLQ